MTTRNRILYWISTIWLATGMVSTGLVQLLKVEDKIQFILDLGYPAYFLTLLGISKLLAVVAILIPGFLLLKEWAYAGLCFMMAGAVYSHIAMGTTNEIFPAILLLVLTLLSWYFRPASRKLVAAA